MGVTNVANPHSVNGVHTNLQGNAGRIVFIDQAAYDLLTVDNYPNYDDTLFAITA